MDLLLVRHAEPLRVELVEGRADPGLADRGLAQAERLGAWLADERVDAVWSSPLRRALETAAPVATAHGLDVVVDEELAEFDRDASSYIPVEELKATADERWTAMVEGRFDESDIDPAAFARTVVGAVERVVAANPGRSVAVVCHGGVVNTYLGHVLGITRPLWFEPRYTSVSRVAASRSGIRSVVSVNETAHLRGTGLLDPA